MRRASLAFSRTFSIPANKPQEVKDAAFYAIYRLSHPDYSLYSCADPYCGLDPYMDVHYSDEAAELYTTANPLRETTEAYPENAGIFVDDLQAAKDHLAAGRRMSRSVSAAELARGQPSTSICCRSTSSARSPGDRCQNGAR